MCVRCPARVRARMCACRYTDQPELVRACCHCVHALRELSAEWGSAGACEAVMKALAAHPGSACVAQHVFKAVAALAEHPDNKPRLQRHRVCEAAIDALNRHVLQGHQNPLAAVFRREHSSAAVAKWACCTIYYLAKGKNCTDCWTVASLIYIFIHPFIYLSIYLFIYLFIYLPIYLSIYLSIDLSIHLSIHQ